jgi:NAD(P)-dependent dehydrogenase (short-subunit alcohol dehydrogenase family)
MTELAGKVVLVTGANRGMGSEYVTQLLDRGVAKVYAAARDPEMITVAEDRVVPLRLDVSSAASIEEASRTATDLSVLINNAGIGTVASVLSKDSSALRTLLDINLLGPLELASKFADRIADRSGAIVNVSSVLAWLPVGAAYGVSKAALWSATESMRLELAPRGVQVVGVYVGLVDSDMGRSVSDGPKSDPAYVVRQVLDGIEAGDEDVLADEFSRQVRKSLNVSAQQRVAQAFGH